MIDKGTLEIIKTKIDTRQIYMQVCIVDTQIGTELNLMKI